MNRWLLSLLSVVLLTNAFILGSALYNRWSAPVQVLTLTERELSLPYWNWQRESSQVALVINWQTAINDELEVFRNRELAVTEAQFRTLRLQPRDCEEKSAHRSSVEGWVALEYNGPAYQHHLRALEKKLEELEANTTENAEENTEQQPWQRTHYQQQLERMRIDGSRLYAVAVAPDPKTLKAQFTDTDAEYWFMPAELSALSECREDRIYVRRLLVDGLHLPAAMHSRIPERQSAPAYGKEAPPSYAVQVAVGRRYQPWIEAVRPCTPAICAVE